MDGIEHVKAYLKNKGIVDFSETYLQIQIPKLGVGRRFIPKEVATYEPNTYYVILNTQFGSIIQIEGQSEVHTTNTHQSIISPVQLLFKSQLIFKTITAVTKTITLELIKIHIHTK